MDNYFRRIYSLFCFPWRPSSGFASHDWFLTFDAARRIYTSKSYSVTDLEYASLPPHALWSTLPHSLRLRLPCCITFMFQSSTHAGARCLRNTELSQWSKRPQLDARPAKGKRADSTTLRRGTRKKQPEVREVSKKSIARDVRPTIINYFGMINRDRSGPYASLLNSSCRTCSTIKPRVGFVF